MDGEKVRGNCYCGQVQYEANLPSKWVGHCHCEACRRSQGAGIVTYAGFAAQAVRFAGGESCLTNFVSETGATRRFCSRCGSTISYQAPRWADEVHLLVANLLDPLDKLPTGHAYSARAPSWCPITDDLKLFDGDSGTEPL
ncbi:MAG: hypothetical protein ACI8X5_000472 [Planctomycetota bacterium]|jgi:hypothetical protein